jgi:hypothetical protein
MQNPIKWVKGWQSPTKRYAFISVLLTIWVLYKEDLLWFSDLYGILVAPLSVLIVSPIVFFVLAFIADTLHSFIHWLEDEK